MADSGYNVMYPYSWLATAGDSAGDSNFQVQNMPGDGSLSGAPNPGGFSGGPVVGSWHPGAPTTSGAVDATYPAYVNAALMNPGNQQPVAGTPALMIGNANDGPVAYSDYANGVLPHQYLSPMPPWKSAPMQDATAALPPQIQTAAASAATVTGTPSNTHQAMRQGGGCAGCSGGCGGKQSCKGRNPPLGLDSTNDFQPLYSHQTANAAQVAGAYLYANTSAKHQAWTVSQGAPADSEAPLQGQ